MCKCTGVPCQMCGGQRTIIGSPFSPPTTQVVKFGGRSLFLLSHLTNPRTVVLNWGDSDIHRGTR